MLLKPSPLEVQEVYLQSLYAIGIDSRHHDLRFVEDNWESPTLGAWGLGWEVWMDGMEISQFTYFQQVGGFDCRPVSVELTYGLERLAMYLQNKDHAFDVVYAPGVTIGDLRRQFEVEHCRYNFEESDAELLRNLFDRYETEANRLLDLDLLYPGYEFVLKGSHHLQPARRARGVVPDRTPELRAAGEEAAQRSATRYLATEAAAEEAA